MSRLLLRNEESRQPPRKNDPGDRPPPDGDDQPWQIYQYRPHIEVTATLVYEEEERGVRHYDLESAYNLDVRGTRALFTHGQALTVPESVKFLQNGNRRVREIRAEQIERLAAVKPTVASAPHPCVVKRRIVDEGINPISQERHPHAGNIPRHDADESTKS